MIKIHFSDFFVSLVSDLRSMRKQATPRTPSLKAILYCSDEQLQRVLAILSRLKLEDLPHIVLIDACADNKLSGSKA